jgi:hypothetical protein
VQGNGKDTSTTTAACIDAETLAAWADGGLSKAHATAVELHLADCDRCTAMLATFARTIPAAPVVESLWKRWHLRWLVPVATAATVAALWVLVPRPESPQIATLSRPTTDLPAPAGAPAAPTPTAPQAQPAETQERESRAAQAPTGTFDRRDQPLRKPGADERSQDQSAINAPTSTLNESIAVAPPQQAREADRADRAEEKRADAKTEQFAPAVPAAGAAPQASAAPPPAAASPESTRTRTLASAARGLTAPVLEIVSPDPMTRWRVMGAGQVERSTNGGRQWQPTTMPESATLTGGSSPSPSICWLVGRTGAVYVTTDGLRFVKVPFTDRSDFVSIRATDGRRATVVTIDGRTMRTEDQGANWTRISP